MSLASSLAILGDGSLPEKYEGLKSHLPSEWIAACLKQHGIASVRKRKLPVEQVVWLVIGMALYRDRPISEIVGRLELVLPGKDGERRGIAKAAIPPARDRLGSEPMAELFGLTAESWAGASADAHRWRGLRLLGMDGSTLRVPDSPENREAFHVCNGSSYPSVRVAALMVLRSRLLRGFAMADCRTSEMTLGRGLASEIPDDSVTVMDRYYYSYALWQAIRTEKTNRHWLVRARKDVMWRVVEEYGPCDQLVEIEVGKATQKKHPELPATIRARAIRDERPGYRPRVLLTSLLDPKLYPGREIGALYVERWELEQGYDEIKTETLEQEETLRSKTPERIRQELWGLTVAYNLIRRQMESVAMECKVAPSRISFRGSLMLLRDLFFWAEVATPGSLPKMMAKMRLNMRYLILPPRRARSYPRRVKSPQRKYLTNRTHPS